MGFFIRTILSEELSTEKKIRYLEFAHSFDWAQEVTEESLQLLIDMQFQNNICDYVYDGKFVGRPEPIEFGINEEDPYGWSTVAAATQVQDLNIVTWLLAHGAEADLANDFGSTPIFIAAQTGNLPIFQLLHGNGAKLLRKVNPEEKGIALLEHAIDYGQREIIELMLSCPEINKPENVTSIESAIAFAKTRHAKTVTNEESSIFTAIIQQLETCCEPLREQKKQIEIKENAAATILQRGYVQFAFKRFIKLKDKSIDELIDNNKLKKAEKLLKEKKDLKQTLGLSGRVTFDFESNRVYIIEPRPEKISVKRP